MQSRQSRKLIFSWLKEIPPKPSGCHRIDIAADELLSFNNYLIFLRNSLFRTNFRDWDFFYSCTSYVTAYINGSARQISAE